MVGKTIRAEAYPTTPPEALARSPTCRKVWEKYPCHVDLESAHCAGELKKPHPRPSAHLRPQCQITPFSNPSESSQPAVCSGPSLCLSAPPSKRRWCCCGARYTAKASQAFAPTQTRVAAQRWATRANQGRASTRRSGGAAFRAAQPANICWLSLRPPRLRRRADNKLLLEMDHIHFPRVRLEKLPPRQRLLAHWRTDNCQGPLSARTRGVDPYQTGTPR